MTAVWILLGAGIGVGGYYLVDRITFPWGATTRQMRHAGWRARKRRA